MTAKEQNRLAGIFLMAHGGFQALIMLFLCFFYGIFGAAIFFGGKGEEKFVGLIFIAVIAVMIVFSLIFVIPQIVGGWKMYQEKANARTWGIIGSIMACMSVPLGTAAGVFGLIYLFGEQGKQFYLNENTNMNYFPNSNYTPNASEFTGKKPDYVKSPPPNSWQ